MKDRVDWGHVAVVVAIGGFVVWFAWDAARASSSVDNLILIVPASVLALVMVLAVLAGELRHLRRRHAPAGAEDGRAVDWRVPAVMALLGLYVLGLIYGPTDLATLIYLGATFYILGERRWWAIALFSVGFTAFLILSLVVMLDVPLPTLILGD